MCKIINGPEASEMIAATLDEIKVRNLICGLQKTKAVVDHNNKVVQQAIDRMVNALKLELEAIKEKERSINNG